MLLGVCLLWGAFVVGANPLPLNDFVKFGDYFDLQLSPDGAHMLARYRTNNRVVLVVVRTSDGQVVSGITPNNNDVLHSATWVSNERYVYEFAEKQIYNEAPIPQGSLYASNIDGSLSRLLYGYQASDAGTGSRISYRDDDRASQEVLSILEDDPDNILIIEYPWSKDGKYWYDNRTKQPDISRLNIYTGRKKKIETLPYGRLSALASGSGEVNFIAWWDQENVSHAAYRKTPDQPWRSLKEAFDISTNAVPFAISNDGTKAYFKDIVGKNALQTLFELNVNTGKYKQLIDEMQTDIADWIYDAKTNTPVIALSFPDKHQYHYIEQESQTVIIHKMLAAAFEGQEVLIVGTSKDGNAILFNVKSDTNPGEYYMFDVKNKDAKFLWANRSWINPQLMNPMTPIKFVANDGVQIGGYLTLPKVSKQNSNLPLVVVLHGGPRSRDYWGFDNEVQMLANNGYAVLQVNYRGSEGYGDVFTDLGNHQWGANVINDVLQATHWAIKNAPINQNKICIYGGSFGGYAALMAAVREPKLYQCAIGYAGVYDLNYVFSESDISGNWGGKAYLEEALGHDKAQLNEFSPINHASEIEAAVLLIHGEKDRRVPVINAEKMHEALSALNKDVTMMSFGMSAHGVYEEKSRLQLYEGLIQFINKHLEPNKK